MQLCRVVFTNLTTLSLSDWCLHGKCKALLYLLEHSPNLEEFTLKMRKVSIHSILWHPGRESYIYSTGFLIATYVLDWHVIISFILCHFGSYDHLDWFPSAAAKTDSPCRETETPLDCEKLKKIEIICPKRDKRVSKLVATLFAKIISTPEICIKPFSGSSW